MFENLTKFLKKFNKKSENKTVSNNSKNAAKERLHLVLMQDRANVSADFLELMKQEIIEVIKKYIDVDESAIDVRLTNKENEDGTNGAPALYANIPIVNIKNEARKVDTKEDKKEEAKKENEIDVKEEDDIEEKPDIDEDDIEEDNEDNIEEDNIEEIDELEELDELDDYNFDDNDDNNETVEDKEINLLGDDKKDVRISTEDEEEVKFADLPDIEYGEVHEESTTDEIEKSFNNSEKEDILEKVSEEIASIENDSTDKSNSNS